MAAVPGKTGAMPTLLTGAATGVVEVYVSARPVSVTPLTSVTTAVMGSVLFGFTVYRAVDGVGCGDRDGLGRADADEASGRCGSGKIRCNHCAARCQRRRNACVVIEGEQAGGLRCVGGVPGDGGDVAGGDGRVAGIDACHKLAALVEREAAALVQRAGRGGCRRGVAVGSRQRHAVVRVTAETVRRRILQSAVGVQLTTRRIAQRNGRDLGVNVDQHLVAVGAAAAHRQFRNAGNVGGRAEGVAGKRHRSCCGSTGRRTVRPSSDSRPLQSHSKTNRSASSGTPYCSCNRLPWARRH